MRMGLFRHLIGGLAGRGPLKRPDGRPNVAADAFDARTAALEATVRELCQADELLLAKEAIIARLPAPATAADAQALMRRVVLPLIEACAARHKAGLASQIEELAFAALIKRFEDPTHFSACLSVIDADMHRMGVSDALPMPPLGPNGVQRLLFFVHKLGHDFAHTQLLHDLVSARLATTAQDASLIGFAGVCGPVPSPLIRSLKWRWPDLEVHGLRVHDGLRGPLLEVARLLASGAYDRVIVVSVPIAISYLTGLLPPARVGWLTMKYQLPCFEHLRHRCSFRSGLRREVAVDGRQWLQAAPLFNGPMALNPSSERPPVMDQARRFGTVLYTINREEKIRNPQFLERVARILERVGNSIFVWTGRERLRAIDDFFEARGLQDRHLFAGWVVPDDLLQTGDLFLDTPVLSGNVAALATTLGIPVLTDDQAITWVGTFLPAYVADRGTPGVAHLDALIEPLRAQGILLQCTGDDQYVEQAVRLAKDPQLRRQFGRALEAFAKHYFFDASQSAADHFENLRAPVPV